MSDRPFSLWYLRVRDDAGVPHHLDFKQWKRSVAAKDPITRESMRQARRATNAPFVLWALLLIGLFGVLRLTAGLHWIGAVVIAALASGTLHFEARRRRAQRAVPFMKTIRACAACGYSMDGIARDGPLTTCPECGARWNLDAIFAAARRPGLLRELAELLGMRFSILDDERRQHEIDATAMWLGWSRKGATRDRLRLPREQLMPSVGSYVVFVVAYMVLSATLLVTFDQLLSNPWLELTTRLVVGGSAAAALGMFTAARFRHRSNRYITLMKARALCPACIHSLEGLPVPVSGLVPCPECGAHWKFDHSTAPPGGLAKPAPASPPPL